MTIAIIPEVLGMEAQIFEDTPMTDAEEEELVIVKTAIKTAYADKLERDLAIGAGLLQIFRRKLYRGKEGGRKWADWLKKESAELTGGRGAIDANTSQYLRGFYQFRCEVLQRKGTCPSGIPLPASPAQVRPLLSQLGTHPDAAVEMWKAAVADAKGKVPTFDQVNRAARAYKANEANEARRLSAAQQTRHQRMVAASCAATVSSVENTAPEPAPEPVSDSSFQPTVPTIPAWELEKDDSAIDAAAECKRITSAITDAHKAIGLLRGILYSQINKHGSDYLGVLRQVDAGVYSLHSIDDQIQQMADDIAFISGLLIADVGEGELAQSTIDVSAMPTRA
jgi:hypothetical protein